MTRISNSTTLKDGTSKDHPHNSRYVTSIICLKTLIHYHAMMPASLCCPMLVTIGLTRCAQQMYYQQAPPPQKDSGGPGCLTGW